MSKTYEEYFAEASEIYKELSSDESAVEHLSEARRENSAAPYNVDAVTEVFQNNLDEEVDCFVATVKSFLPDGEKSE